MSVTLDELDDFRGFAATRLANGGAESMAELVAAWESQRRHDNSVDALKESHADAEADRVVSADEVFAETRKALGLPG